MADPFAPIFGSPDLDEAETNPFAKVMPRPVAPPTSATGAFARGVARGVVPAAGGIAGAAAGAETGAVVGAFPLFSVPTGGLSVPIGGILGGLGGAIAGSYAASSAQHYALSKAPDKWREAIGMDDRQERLDEAAHPYASFLGGLAPFAVTMNPMSAARAALPANATAIQRIMANPKTARVFGGVAMGGMELGQEAIGPEPIDWRKVAISTAMGVVLNRPNVIGERIGEWGAAPARRVLGVPPPQIVSRETPAQEPVIAPAEPLSEVAPAAAPVRGIAPTLFHAPTVAQAGDVRVMGPGVTEEVFHGTHEANPIARMAAQDTARVELETIGPTPVPDLHSLARRSTPDLFNRYDELQGQRSDLAAVAAQNPQAQAHLIVVEREIAALEPQVAAAHRRAAEAAGVPIVSHPEAPAIPGRPIAEQKQFIADDVARQLVRAGRPADEAALAGQLVAARYEARAAQFGGARGSAEELYRAEAAEIRGPAGPATPAAPAAEPLRGMLDRRATPDEIARHPDVVEAQRENDSRPETQHYQGYGTPEFEANRVFEIDGEKVVGYDNAVKHLVDKARGYSIKGPVKKQRVATLVLGPPASGKSRLSEKIAAERGAAIIDPDDAKLIMPEYAGGRGTSATHEESARISSRALAALLREGDNVVIPRVGGSLASVRAYIDNLTNAGYTVDIANLTVDPAEAYRRMIRRFLKTGRIIGSTYFSGIGTKPRDNYYIVKNEGKIREAIDVDGNGPPGSQRFIDGGDSDLAAALGEPRGGDRPPLAGGDQASRPGAERQDLTVAAPIPGPIPNGVQQFSPADLHVDAKRFQFKEGGDEAGVTERLKGVKQWDPIKAGMVLVWQDAFGKNYIVDGHQRHGLALRIGAEDPAQNPQILGRVLREADGISDSEARTIAALKNIAEGTGTAVDAAKVLREHPERGAELPPRSELFRQAQGLVNLSDDAFRMVINDVVPANYAAIVGRLVPENAEMQGALIGLLAKTEPANMVQAESIVRQGIEAGLAKREKGAQASLFGDEDVAESLYLERAKVLDRALKEIKQDKKVFSVLTKEQESIEKAGNKLAADVNQKRAAADAQALQILQTLANRTGPISDALATAAERARKDGKYREAVAGFVKEIRGLMEGNELARLADGVERGPTHVGAENRAGIVDRAPETVGPIESTHVAERVHEEMERVLFQRKQEGVSDLFAAREAEGQQGLPGAERIGQGELAQRRAEQPLKPTVAQRPMDIGLFGDEAAQQELFQAAQGKFRPMEGETKISRGIGARRPIITLMREANASTFIHETGHDWLEQLMRDATHQAAPDVLKQDAATVLHWLGVEAPGDIARRQHEKFARGFEQYMREGVAPSAGLAHVFARFKQWLVSIYQSLKGLGVPISEDIRRVFDRMITAEPQGTVIAEPREVRPSLADIHEIDAAETIHADADAVGDRVEAEAQRSYTDVPEDIRREYETWLAEKAAREAEGGEPGAGTEPHGEAGPGGGAGDPLAGVRGEPEPLAGGGGVRGEHEPLVEGAAGAAREGAGSAGPGERSRGSEESGNAQLAPSPATRFAPTDERTVDLAGNIRVENLTSIDDIAQAIHDSADRNADFVGARGSMTKGQMMDLADAMGLDAEKIDEGRLATLLGGTANLAPRILAARKLVVDSAAVVSDAMKKAATGTDEDVAALAIAIARHDLIQGALAGATAEWGRAGSAFHSLLSGWGEAEKVNEFLKANTGRTLFQLKQIAKLGTQLDTPGKVSKYLRDAQNRSFGGMILEYWINGLISGPATHTTYMIGNAILAAEKAGPETAAAALIGSLRAAMGREGETVRLGEVGAQFKAAIRDFPKAIQASLEGLETGMTTLLPGETARPLIPFSGDTSLITARGITNAPVHWAEVGAQAFGILRGIRDGFMSGAALLAAGGEAGAPNIGFVYSPLGQIPDIAIRGVRILPGVIPGGTMFRLPGRGIAAIHSFFRTTLFSMNKAAGAYRTASNEGLTGTAFDARVGELWQNPPVEKMEEYRLGATELTLMGQGGAFVKALSQFMNAKVDFPVLGKFAPLKFIDPFVHIGANVINQSIVHRTPVGILSAEIRADLMGKNGNVAQDTAMARMLVGTALSIAMGGLASQGFASGSGPKDPKEAAMWKLAGNQPHSVRLGDIWIDVHRLGPMGMLMGIAADMYEVGHQLSEAEYVEAAAHFQHAVTQNVLDESFMRGPAELMRAVEDPGRYGDAYIRNHLASFVPFSVGMAQLARASDPYSRQARTVLDAMIDKIPGYSETLYPRRDIWGEPLPNRTALGVQGFSALWVQQVSTDPVNLEMVQLGVSPAPVPRKIRNVELTDEQYDQFARIAGRMTKMRLDVIVRSPDWRTWPNHVKVDVIQEVLKQSREVGRGIMMMKYPQIARDATALKLEKLQD